MGDTHAAAEFEQADGADDVGDLVFERAVHRRAHTGQGGKVDHGVEGPVGQLPLADVADVERHALWQRIRWRDVVEAGDPVPCRVEMPDDMGADETGGSGDEDGERGVLRAMSQPAPDCAGPSGYGALIVPRRRAPLKPALRVPFIPVTPPVAVPGQMPHDAELTFA